MEHEPSLALEQQCQLCIAATGPGCGPTSSVVLLHAPGCSRARACQCWMKGKWCRRRGTAGEEGLRLQGVGLTEARGHGPKGKTQGGGRWGESAGAQGCRGQPPYCPTVHAPHCLPLRCPCCPPSPPDPHRLLPYHCSPTAAVVGANLRGSSNK